MCSDEAYSELWFDEPPVSALQVADRENVVVFNTLSKRSSMTGYRSGFVCAPQEICDALRAFRPTVGTAPQEFVQRASVAAWSDDAHVEDVRALYARKRAVLLPALEERGLRLAGSAATFYLWVDVGGPAEAFSKRLLEHGIVSAPGSFFGPAGDGLRPLRAGADGGRVRAGGGDHPERPVSDAAAVVAALDRGEVRVAEPDGDEWRVNADVQEAILAYFRERQMEPREVGPFEYHDKIPLKSGYAELGVRVVPPAVARFGAFLSRGVVLMPSYVNIGAWVGPNTMVDTWATVGSGAQIGAGVHLAGGVGIGGVLEPPGSRPVIVEDGAFIGSRCIVVEGVRIGREAVLAPNVTLTASVPIIDVTGPEPVEHRGYVPPRSIVVPGTRPKEFPAGHLPPRVRADHRPAPRVDRPEDVAERRPARARHRHRLTESGATGVRRSGASVKHQRSPSAQPFTAVPGTSSSPLADASTAVPGTSGSPLGTRPNCGAWHRGSPLGTRPVS